MSAHNPDFSIMERDVDGAWTVACPEPLWVGLGLRIAQCECGQQFKTKRYWFRRIGEFKTSARDRYRHHWYDTTIAELRASVATRKDTLSE